MRFFVTNINKNLKQINMENLIGKKVKGFKFETEIPDYVKSMDKQIGAIGEIVKVNSISCQVQFEDDWWNYPTPEIHKHLVDDEIKPFEKVWAWDEAEDAFQTYYIKKAKCGHMVVSEDRLIYYENEHSFKVVCYENISRTNPNETPNDVIKIIEKYGDDKLITLIESYRN